MTPPLIKCACCDGTGKHELSALMWATLKRVRKNRVPIGAAALSERGVTGMAINNRLTFLERAGLVRRAGKDGKFILWEAVKP